MTQVMLHGTLESMLQDADTLKPHPRNARAQDSEVIRDSILRNGVYRPLYVQKSTRYILAGNHTYEALLSLGLEKVPVLEVDVDDDTALRIMLADNRIPDLGRYDDGLLADVLAELAELGPEGLLGTGYALSDVETIIDTLNANTPAPWADVDTDEETDYKCPKCHYEWNGEPRPLSPH